MPKHVKITKDLKYGRRNDDEPSAEGVPDRKAGEVGEVIGEYGDGKECWVVRFDERDHIVPKESAVDHPGPDPRGQLAKA